LQQSKVAIIGLNAVQSEIAKNIILAGLNELTIFDWVQVEPHHCVPHLFLDPKSAIGQNRATASKARLSELNPLVRVTAVELKSPEAVLERFQETSAGEGSSSFDLVIASDLSTLQLSQLNDICRTLSPPASHLLKSPAHPNIARSLPFVAVNTFGMFGFFFMDLGNHIYTKETTHSDGSKTMSTALQTHCSLQQALDHDTTSSSPDGLYYSFLALHRTEKLISSKATESSLTIMKSEREKLIADLKLKAARFPEDVIETIANCHSFECAPVSAVVGGLVGQESIKCLSASSPAPLNNFFFYNALSGVSSVLAAGV
jgi:ubiquitin-like 1-activating enzyme E1 A